MTRHARNRMRLYDVAMDDVREALQHPDQVLPGSAEYRHAWRRSSRGGWLRVTFTDEGARRVVITVTPKRTFSGGIDAH